MRENIRHWLRARGYDLHRFLPVSSPEAQLGHALTCFGVDLVLDVGANTGQYAHSLRQNGYQGRIISIEPLPDAHAALAAAAAADPAWTAAPRSAIGDHDGEITINIAGNSASSSILAMREEHRTAAPESAYIGSTQVPIHKLDTMAGEWLATAKAPYVKVDTQGYEAQVLAGGPVTIAAAVAVQLEMSMAPLYDGQPDFADMLAAMTARGFVLWSIWPSFADPATGRILQCDAIFARPERAGRAPGR